ncbi:hypothetical protein PInf_008621 [Phytophthora infestans]|nr:hypothetical protein PInf_008621 [Phytophthora infestans]
MIDDWKTLEAKIECPAQINACVRETGNWGVCVTGPKTGHSHDISQAIYQTYHEARNVPESEVISTAIRKAGARKFAPTKDRFIYKFAACRIRLVETSALHGCAPECIMKQFISAVTTMLGFTTGRPIEITRCGDKESCPGSKLREEKAEARPADQHEGGSQHRDIQHIRFLPQ